jgi:uncharacterized surface protein with fasciclin (FAS1) repeats
MKKRILTTVLAAVLGTSAMAVSAPAASAAPTGEPKGQHSLAAVLAKDGHKFDHKWNDFDIVDAAVTAVLANDPSGDVGVLADGSTALTAFLPTDRAFRHLVTDLTGTKPRTEKATFTKLVDAVGVGTVESVLLYHVVPGATITYKQALGADGADLTTALGPAVTVNVHGKRIRLQDQDPDAVNARVLMQARDINKGNLQIAHGISRVLRPQNL